jgi:Domain of unknown function (DUF4387)
MLTLDLFFVDALTQHAFIASGALLPERIGALYGVDPALVDNYEIPEIYALKISFPRPIPSGDFGDTDVTGGQQYALVVDLLAGLEVEGEGAGLVVIDPATIAGGIDSVSKGPSA